MVSYAVSFSDLLTLRSARLLRGRGFVQALFLQHWNPRDKGLSLVLHISILSRDLLTPRSADDTARKE